MCPLNEEAYRYLCSFSCLSGLSPSRVLKASHEPSLSLHLVRQGEHVEFVGGEGDDVEHWFSQDAEARRLVDAGRRVELTCDIEAKSQQEANSHPFARKRHVSTKALVAALYPSMPLLTKVAHVAAMIPPDLVPAIVGGM